MFNKNKIIASFTCLIIVLVAVFIFVCPLSYSEIVLPTKHISNASGCENSTGYSATHINDFAKKCLDFHVANVNLFLNTKINLVNVFSILFVVAVFAYLIKIKPASADSFFALPQLRHRYLFYLNKLKLLQGEKFQRWLTLFRYHEIVSVA